MTAPVKLNFKIYQGATFRETLRWESSTKVYKPITAITKSAPIQITAPVHEVPEGWRIKVTNVQGMKEINSTDVYRTAHVTSVDVLEINDINAVGFSDYTSGGIVEYNEPVSLATVTARMQFREKLDSEVALLELTTENGGIVIDDVNKTITIIISATQSAAFTWSSAVYSLELIRGSDVTQFITGNAQLIREVTR
jgi:hypothetical protein